MDISRHIPERPIEADLAPSHPGAVAQRLGISGDNRNRHAGTIQSEDFHNQAWEKHFGSRPVVPVKPQPYW